MNRLVGLGRASRVLAIGLVPAAGLSVTMLRHREPLRCDSAASGPSWSARNGHGPGSSHWTLEPSPQTVRQISSGSVLGEQGPRELLGMTRLVLSQSLLPYNPG